MIGVRRGWGGNFCFEVLAWEMMKNMMRQKNMLIAAALFSDIPPVVDSLSPPSSTKWLSGVGKEKRNRPRDISETSGALHPTKGVA